MIAADVEAKGFEGIFLAPTWVPETPVANGRLALTMMGVVANNEIEADVNFQRIPVDIHRTDDTLGVGDLYPTASISWNSGVNNYKLYATGDIPVGDYDPKRLANIGIGHGAIDGGGAYTYFNPETGHELSGTLGFTYNFENTESEDYKNGIDMHLDWGVSQWLSKTTMFGVAGYLYYQLTDDTYPTDTPLGLLRERILGFGPLAKFGDDDLSLTLNALFDKTFGKYRTPGTGLDYAAQFKFAVADGLSAGAELFGSISDLGDVPSFNATEFRVGPVLYLSWRSDQTHFGLTGDIGVLLVHDGCNAEHHDQMGFRVHLLVSRVSSNPVH